MKNDVFWDGMLCGSCRSDVVEEVISSRIRVTRISEGSYKSHMVSHPRRWLSSCIT
jgi:hypothetical protein